METPKPYQPSRRQFLGSVAAIALYATTHQGIKVPITPKTSGQSILDCRGSIRNIHSMQDSEGIKDLARSISERGMLSPVGIEEGGRLLWGFRRMAALQFARKMNLPIPDTIPAVILPKIKPKTWLQRLGLVATPVGYEKPISKCLDTETLTLLQEQLSNGNPHRICPALPLA